jgi:outer membrane protein assembly factor BamA
MTRYAGEYSERRALWAALVCGAALFSEARVAHTEEPSPPPESARPHVPGDAELEERQAVIGEIYFNIGDIFNELDPREDKSLYRLANRLHIKTRESAIRAQLLFTSGDRYSARLIQETERVLRRLDFIQDATIHPIAYDGQKVDLLVQTRDVWTLQPGFSYERKGGENATSIEVEEENLLGYGKSVKVEWSKDVERTAVLVQYRDPNVLWSRWRSELAYSINDDGRLRLINLDRPFYSLDSRWSAGGTLFDFSRVDPRYDLGEIVDEFRHEESFAEIRGGISAGLVNGWTRRWLAGFRYDHNEFAVEPGRAPPAELPPDRRLAYPWVGLSFIEDEYRTTQNLDQIGRLEDLYFGTSMGLTLGYASESLGSDRNAVIATAGARTALPFNERHLMFVDAAFSGRLESGDIADGLVSGNARYYWRWHPRATFFALASGEASEALDPEEQIQLGGDSGLRGYPLRYQTGTSRALLTLEQRVYTEWFPWRLFYIGGAMFFDMGRTWGRGAVGAESRGWLKDVGIGLRLGNARGAFGSVLHFDVAFPLDRTPDIDSVQFIVETKQSF